MFVKRAWYSAGWSGELGDAPMTRQFLGAHVALFRDAGGRAHAISALCPHRGADLGRGTLVDGALECPFHGWRFDVSGRCVRIPSQPADVAVTAKARVPVYPVAEEQGIVWIWMDPDTLPDRAPPRYEFFDRNEGWGRYNAPMVVYEGSFLNVVENALDGAHLAFVHRGSIGEGQDPLDPGITVRLMDDGRSLLATTRPTGLVHPNRRGDTAENRAGEFAPNASQDFRFELGGFVVFESVDANGKEEVIFAFITPKDETSTWFWAGNIRNRGLNETGDAVTRRFFDKLVDEDKVAMSLLLPPARGAGGLAHPVFVAADKQAVAFRKLYGDALRAEGHKTVPWALGDESAWRTAPRPAA